MTRTPNMLAGLKQTTLWRLARAVKRSLVPPRPAGPLAGASCRSLVTVVDPPAALEAGRPHGWRCRVENRGDVGWPTDGPHAAQMVLRWEVFTGERFGEPIAVLLPGPVYPGEPVEVTGRVPTPAFAGDFVLVAELEQPAGQPLTPREPQAVPARITVPVFGPRATDIDYHAVYRSADLDRNHWWVVGAYHSREEFEASRAARLGMLQSLGLTPDSRVLDVGCGTGQMAGPLEGYLSDRGAYYGTDIGKEAVEFCQRTFRRRNFVFRQGAMTRLPFAADDGPFDLAIYFSVFTHTFVDESALLLAETARLLKPDGRIVADVIVSPLVERCGGHRGEMVVNREHFLRLAEVAGLTAEVIGRWPWNPHAERLMLVLRRG